MTSFILMTFFFYFSDFISDFDLMLEKKKAEMSKRRKKKKDIDILNDNDDMISEMIRKMKEVAEVRILFCTKKCSCLGFIEFRPVHLARPTSGTIQFEPRTCPYCPQQVPRTCLAISQLPLDSEKSMTYQFISTFYDKSISYVRIKVWCLIME